MIARHRECRRIMITHQYLKPQSRKLRAGGLPCAVAAALMAVLSMAMTPVRAATIPLAVDTASGRHVFQVDIADTDEARTHGLMFRRSLPADYGMLFVFDERQPLMFWMKNTYVPLDIVFIKSDGTVRTVAAQATPLSEALIRSGGAARYVLELLGGTAGRIGLGPGDRIEIPAQFRTSPPAK